MAPNFVLAAVASLLLYSGWKNATIKNVFQGGEAEGSTSSGTSQGGAEVPGGGESSALGAVAGGRPTHLPPQPSQIKLPATTKTLARKVESGLHYKEQLEKLVKEKRMSKPIAESAFKQRFPHYAEEARKLLGK